MVAGLGGALIWLAWTIWRVVEYFRTTPRKLTNEEQALQALERDVRDVIDSAASTTPGMPEFALLLAPVRLARHLKLLGIPCPPDGDRDMWGRFAVELLVLAETGNLKKAQGLLAEVENDPKNS